MSLGARSANSARTTRTFPERVAFGTSQAAGAGCGHAVPAPTWRSDQAVQKAVRNGIARESKTLRNPRLLEVTEIPGHIVDGDVGHLQVTMNIRSK